MARARTIDQRKLALWLYEKLWLPQLEAENLALVAAMIGDAPTIRPDDLTGRHREALRTFQAEGRQGLIYRRLARLVAPLLDSYNPTREELTRALRLLSERSARAALAAKALALRAELDATLALLK